MEPSSDPSSGPGAGSPLTLLHGLSSAGFYGCEKLVSELTALQIRTPGLKVYFMAFLDPDQETSVTADRLEAEGVETIRFRSKPRLDLKGLFAYGARLRELGVDLVHSHGYKPTFVHLASRLLGRHRVPLCITLHGYNRSSGSLRAALYERLDMFLFRFAAQVVCVSEADRQYVARHNAAIRTELVPNGIRTELKLGGAHPLRESLSSEARALPVLGTVGRLVAVKNQELLLRGHALVRERHPCTLALVGDGPLRESLEALARELGTHRDVLFIPFQENILDWMADLDVFALTSHSEGLPMTLLEAGLLGKAVVCSRVGAIPEVVVPGETGFLFPSGDTAAFADAVARCLADRAAAARMGEALRARVTDRYSIEATSRSYRRLYEQALARKAGPSPKTSR